MNRTFLLNVASVATLSLAVTATAHAQPANVLNIVGQAQVSSPGAGSGFPLFIDFLSGASYPPGTVGLGIPGNVFSGAVSGLFSGIPGNTNGLIQDLTVNASGTSTSTNPSSAASTFMTIGGYTFTFTGAPNAPSGGFNFGPVTLTQLGSSTLAAFTVNGLVSGPGFNTGSTYAGIFTAQFVNQTPAQVFNGINTGGTPIVTFSANFAATQGSTVPEPSTYVLLASGMGALGLIARRRRTQV